MSLILALGLSILVAAAGALLRALTTAGALTASLLGTAILWPLGWAGLAAVGAFFVGASVISRGAPDPTERFDAKGPRRDARQVLANGGAAALGALLELILPGPGLWIATGSLAAAAADTWATSAGGWSRTAPRLILNLRPVPPGTNGGVTLYGNAGALVGAATVGAAVVLAGAPRALFPVALGVGMLGMLVDSVLGAAWQGRFHCPRCLQATERAVHRCGTVTTTVGGIRWLTNDGVNAVATFIAGGLGFMAWILLQ